MLIQRVIDNKDYAVEIGKPLYEKCYQTEAGQIKLALIKPYEDVSLYDIFEVTTGRVVIHNVGHLSKISFYNISDMFCKFGARKIKSCMATFPNVEELPLWKEK